MRIRILDVSQAFDDRGVVAFGTACGHGVARWIGEPVQAGEIHYVELTIEETLVWGSTIVAAEKGDSMSFDGQVLTLHGELVEPSDGDSALKVCGSIVLFDAHGVPDPVPLFVVVRARDVTLYDTNFDGTRLEVRPHARSRMSVASP